MNGPVKGEYLRQSFDRHRSVEKAIIPDGPLTTLELQNLWHDVSESHTIRQFPHVKALKLRRERSGT